MANMAMSAPRATPGAASDDAAFPAAATLATDVPWETVSLPVSSTAPGRNCSVTVFPANAGWSRSMPVSRNPMVTPAPGSTPAPFNTSMLA